MAIDTISPVANSVVAPGDALSFYVDDTYTAISVEVETSGGWEYAYDSAIGGAQPGYTVAISIPTAGRHKFTVTRTTGWDVNPFRFRVIEDETGSPATTVTTYYLETQVGFPQGSDPYFGEYTGDLIVSDTDTVISRIVKQLDVAGVGYSLADLGNGKVRLTLSGGVTTFEGLSDTPAYSGNALKAPRVNAGETGLEYYTPATTFPALTDTPASYSGNSLKSVRVNAGETALEYYTPTGGASGAEGFGQWEYAASTVDAAPGDGFFRLDNFPGVANTMYIDAQDKGGASFYTTCASWGVGTYFVIQNTADPTYQCTWEVTGPVIQSAGYLKIPVNQLTVGTSGTIVPGQVCKLSLVADQISINDLPVKTPPVGADIVLVEDSAASFAKKKVTLTDIIGLAGGGTGGIGTWTMFDVTGANPTTPGDMSVDFAAVGSVSRFELNDTSADIDLSAALLDLEIKDYIYVRAQDGTAYGLWRISAKPSDLTSFVQIDCTYVTGTGTFANGKDYDVGVVTLALETPATTVVANAPLFGDTTGDSLTGSGAYFTPDSIISGTISKGSASVVTIGHAVELSTGVATVNASGTGAIGIGKATSNSTGNTNVLASNEGSVVIGGAISSGGGIANLTSTGIGSIAIGYSIVSSGIGTNALITAAGKGSLALGCSENTSSATPSIQTSSTATGGLAGGYATNGGNLQAVNPAGFSWGYSTGTNSRVYSSNYASVALGYTSAAGKIDSSGFGTFCSGAAFGVTLSATNSGSVALGLAVTNNITSSGAGSLAIGSSASGAIVASADNSAQFGPGTNSTANSLQVGSNFIAKAAGAYAGARQTVTLGVAATTFAISSTSIEVTGDAGGNTVATITGGTAGQFLALQFVDANVTITDDNTHAANTVDLNAAFTSADDTILFLFFDGTSWYEVSRSVN